MRARKGLPALRSARRTLRTSMSAPELVFWTKVRMRQFHGLKFRRQHGIGPYIVDFYCADQNLVIEIDGETHGNLPQLVQDQQRDSYLHSLGLRVVRYTNHEVLTNLAGVLDDLETRMGGSTSPSPSLQRRGN